MHYIVYLNVVKYNNINTEGKKMKKSINLIATTVFILLTFYLVMPAQATISEVEVVADCEEFRASGFFYACYPWHDGDYVTYAVELTLSNATGGILTTYFGQDDPISGEGIEDGDCGYFPFNFTEDWGPLPSGEYTVEGELTAQHAAAAYEHDSLLFGPIIFECGDDVVEGCTLGFWKNNGGVVQKNGKTDDDCWCG
jgi:hypothetical protein